MIILAVSWAERILAGGAFGLFIGLIFCILVLVIISLVQDIQGRER